MPPSPVVFTVALKRGCPRSLRGDLVQSHLLSTSSVSSFPVVWSVAVFQWLKQIEGTEAALTQKMLDLEKEKVKDMPRPWEGGG